MSPPTKMRDNRCSKCHRYKKDPPSPELGHDGCHAESKCKLDHHPAPCDYVDDAGNTCVPSVNTASENAGAQEIEGKISAQSLELEQLRAEMLEMRRMVGSLRQAAPATASLATSTEQFGTVTTTSHSGSRMSLLSPQMSNTGAGAHSLSTGELSAAAQQLINVNENRASVGNSLGDYAGPNMKELQKDSTIADEVQKQLAALIAGTPALQKVVAGQVQRKTVATPISQHSNQQVDQRSLGAHSLGDPHPAFQAIQSGAAGITSAPQREDYNLLDMDSLLGLTVRDKQYRPHEFAAKGNFFYAKNINDRNITLPLYVYGYLKHCIILSSGLVPVQEGEVMARLVHLMNVMEITSNNSTLNDFDHSAWQLGRGYGDRVFNDIQQGLRSWTEMPNHILPDVFLHVKDMVDMQTRKKDTNARGGGGGAGRGAGRGRGANRERTSERAGGDSKPLVCTTYNDFFTGSGCSYEYNNQRKCNYEHYCSKCFASTGNKVTHKARFCGEAASVAVSTSG